MNIIAIVDQNWGIGNEGEQLLYLAPDLKRFQQLTSGHPILLGRKTLETFPAGKPLKNRRNLILSRKEDFHVEEAEVFDNLNALLKAAPDDSFVVGGESVYRQLLPHCERAFITKVQRSYQADCYFPNLDQDPIWSVEEEEGPFLEEDLSYTYVTYRRA